MEVEGEKASSLIQASKKAFTLSSKLASRRSLDGRSISTKVAKGWLSMSPFWPWRSGKTSSKKWNCSGTRNIKLLNHHLLKLHPPTTAKHVLNTFWFQTFHLILMQGTEFFCLPPHGLANFAVQHRGRGEALRHGRQVQRTKHRQWRGGSNPQHCEKRSVAMEAPAKTPKHRDFWGNGVETCPAWYGFSACMLQAVREKANLFLGKPIDSFSSLKVVKAQARFATSRGNMAPLMRAEMASKRGSCHRCRFTRFHCREIDRSSRIVAQSCFKLILAWAQAILARFWVSKAATCRTPHLAKVSIRLWFRTPSLVKLHALLVKPARCWAAQSTAINPSLHLNPSMHRQSTLWIHFCSLLQYTFNQCTWMGSSDISLDVKKLAPWTSACWVSSLSPRNGCIQISPWLRQCWPSAVAENPSVGDTESWPKHPSAVGRSTSALGSEMLWYTN